MTLIGNMEASVHVLDQAARPLDAGNLKQHLEKDYIVSEQEQKAAALGGKATKSEKAGGLLNIFKGGGDAGDIARVAGAGDPLHDALSASAEKVDRLPTDSEWKSALVEGMATKVANRIVPVDEEFVVILPGDKEFAQVRDMAKAGRWGDVQEKLETASPMTGRAEANRVYLLGLSYEAIAYTDASTPDKAADLLNKASQKYKQAADLQSHDREFELAQIRVQDSLDHYLEIQHYLQNAKQQQTAPTRPTGSVEGTTTAGGGLQSGNGADNAKLIQMSAAGLSETVLLTFVRSAADPKFDVSANGLLELAEGKVPEKVIEAVQQRMADPAGKTGPRRSTTPRRTPAQPQ